MTRNFLYKLWPMALLAALVLTACNGSSSQPGATPSDVSAPQKATATISIKFPQAGAVKALVDDRTSKIQLNWFTLDSYFMDPLGTMDLTPADPTAIIDVPLGPIMFEAVALQGSAATGYTPVARASTVGQIVGGNTSIVLRFLVADWQFVDANDNPVPLAVGDATVSTTLHGFSLGYLAPNQMDMFDRNKLRSKVDYAVRWYKDDGAGTALPFGNDDQVQHATQFVSDGTTTSNASAIEDDGLILDGTIPQSEPLGKRIAFMVGLPPEDGTLVDSNNQDLIPTFTPYADTRDIDGSHITGHLIELTYDNHVEELAPNGANVDCSLYYSQSAAAARASAVSQFMAQAAGAQKAAGTPVVTGTFSSSWTECYEGTTVVDGDGDDDMVNDYLTYDANYNFRYDPLDGDTFYDINGDGHFDYTYTAGNLYTITETYSNAVAHPFRAKASSINTTLLPVVPNPAGATFVQYRTFENSSADRPYAFIDYRRNGFNLRPADIANVQLFDPSGTELYANPSPVYRSGKYLQAGWDGVQGQFGTAVSGGYSGYGFDLPYDTLVQGDYTFVTTLTSGKTIQTAVSSSGQIALPVVASASMNYLWNADDSLTLSWTEPVGSFDTYRIILFNPADGKEVFFGSAPPGTAQVTLPAALVQSILTNANLPAGTALAWRMQTRNYNATNNNVARGISEPVTIFAPGTGTTVIIR